MHRWFRRKGKDKDRDGENEAAPLVEETETSPEAAAGEEAMAEPGPAAPEAALPQAETKSIPEKRGGLFRRWRREPQAEEGALVAGEEGAAASEAEAVVLEPIQAPPPEPPPPPEREAPPAIPAPPEPGAAATSQVIREEVIAPEILEAGDLEEIGEVPETAERRGMFRRLRDRLSRTREALSGGLDRLFRGRKVVDAQLLEELEELLITADLGVETSLYLIQALQEKLKRRELGDVERLKAALQAEMVGLLTSPPQPEQGARPWVVLLVGVNGVGKTTSIAKLAHRDRQRGLTPLLVAADTFRAAAVEQLEIWGSGSAPGWSNSRPGPTRPRWSSTAWPRPWPEGSTRCT